MYVALRVIKQVINKKVEVYYERILKLANYLNHKVDNNLFMTLFQAGLVPNLWVTNIRMKRDTLFLHKKTTMTYEKSMGDANEYWKLLELQWKKIKIKDF